MSTLLHIFILSNGIKITPRIRLPQETPDEFRGCHTKKTKNKTKTNKQTNKQTIRQFQGESEIVKVHKLTFSD